MANNKKFIREYYIHLIEANDLNEYSVNIFDRNGNKIFDTFSKKSFDQMLNDLSVEDLIDSTIKAETNEGKKIELSFITVQLAVALLGTNKIAFYNDDEKITIFGDDGNGNFNKKEEAFLYYNGYQRKGESHIKNYWNPVIYKEFNRFGNSTYMHIYYYDGASFVIKKEV